MLHEATKCFYKIYFWNLKMLGFSKFGRTENSKNTNIYRNIWIFLFIHICKEMKMGHCLKKPVQNKYSDRSMDV